MKNSIFIVVSGGQKKGGDVPLASRAMLEHAWLHGTTDHPTRCLKEQIIALCYLFTMGARRLVDMLVTFEDFN
jgi:hypothetical protein